MIAANVQGDVYHDVRYLNSVVGNSSHVIDACSNIHIPLIRRPLPDWLDEPSFVDGESPYGYACPLVDQGKTVDWDAVKRELAAAGFVNVFLRGHPFLPWCGLPTVHEAVTAVIPLQEGREQAFAGGACATHRSQVNRARKLGFTARLQEAPADLTEFRQLYEHTMQRLSAAESYYFDDAAWESLRSLGVQLALVTVLDDAGAVHAQALFLRGSRWAHYHLSARSDTAHNASSHLLFEAAADWAVGHRLEAIHLGGGTSGRDDDPLLAFKRRIGKATATFRTAGLIAQPDVHARLLAKWQERTSQAPRWFQGYRQPFPISA